jgi:hypothetical protein
MLETSQDLFWVALAFAIFWIGLGLGLAGLYVALVLRNFYMISSSVKKKLEVVDAILSTIRKKVESTASYMPPLIEGVSKIIEAFSEKKKSDREKASRRKK